MEHLSPETLGRLVDDSPTAAERAHLGACADCTAELEAMRRQTSLLRRLPDLRPAPADFTALEARLTAEGLIRPRQNRQADLAFGPRWVRQAAAIALFVGGAATGAAFMARERPAPAATAAAAEAPAADPAAALARVEEAERAYVAALAQYRQLAGAEEDAGDPAARYAALEELVRAGRVAVRQAPADPFLNGLLASALAEQRAVYDRISGDAAEGGEGWY